MSNNTPLPMDALLERAYVHAAAIAVTLILGDGSRWTGFLSTLPAYERWQTEALRRARASGGDAMATLPAEEPPADTREHAAAMWRDGNAAVRQWLAVRNFSGERVIDGAPMPFVLLNVDQLAGLMVGHPAPVVNA